MIRIVEERIQLPPTVVRSTGRESTRVYWVANGDKRVGPFNLRAEAVAIYKRARRIEDGLEKVQ